MASELFAKEATIFQKIDTVFNDILGVLQSTPSADYDFEYDRLVPFGEILSSLICANYFKNNGINCGLQGARELIITDSIYRGATINWAVSEQRIKDKINFSAYDIYVTQGFIGSDTYSNSTTLGREGSDFSASVIAYCLGAERVDFWKGVNGIYNCDPEINKDFILLPRLSYREVVEQIYFGAKILHPKTIKPLQNKKIPIRVRPFDKPYEQGTIIEDISKFNPAYYPEIPVFIEKKHQILISFSPRDFSFINEENLGLIFSALAKFRLKAHLMQNSALKFSICTDNIPERVKPFLAKMKASFQVLSNENLRLVTIRHYSAAIIEAKIEGCKIYISQRNRRTARFVFDDN